MASPEIAQHLEEEIHEEIARLREAFPDEWAYLGDLDAESLVRRVVGRDEPAWFADLIQPRPNNAIAALAKALGATWEYDFLYEAWSAFAHGRGISKDVVTEGDAAGVHHPHRPTWFTLVAFFSVSWQEFFLMTAAKWLCPVMVPQLQQLHLRHGTVIQELEPDEAVYGAFID